MLPNPQEAVPTAAPCLLSIPLAQPPPTPHRPSSWTTDVHLTSPPAGCSGDVTVSEKLSRAAQTRVALFCFSGSRHSSQGRLRRCVRQRVVSHGPAPPESRSGDSRNQAAWVNTNKPKCVAIGASRLSWGACLNLSGRSPRQWPLDPRETDLRSVQAPLLPRHDV